MFYRFWLNDDIQYFSACILILNLKQNYELRQ